MKTEAIKKRFGAQFNDWKSQYGKVFGYVSTDGKTGVFRTPDMTILDLCSTIAKGSQVKYDQALIANCWLGGDEELKTETKYILGLKEWLADLIEVVNGEMVEL